MRKMCATLLMAISMGSFHCKLPTAADDPNVISSLHFTPSAFDSFKRNTELKYTLKAPSIVHIYIVKIDSSGRSFFVKTLAANLNETKGSHSITWLGDTDQRLFAPVGTYLGVVQISERKFQTIVQIFHF